MKVRKREEESDSQRKDVTLFFISIHQLRPHIYEPWDMINTE